MIADDDDDNDDNDDDDDDDDDEYLRVEETGVRWSSQCYAGPALQ